MNHTTMIISDKYKCMASLAVFREMYEAKKDIFSIIADYITGVIIEKGLTYFSETDMVEYLNSECGFEIIQAVVKTSLKRVKFVKKVDGKTMEYSVDWNKIKTEETEYLKKKKIAEDKNNHFHDILCLYYSQKSGAICSNETRAKLWDALCSFLLDKDQTVELSEYVSGFIISNSENHNNQINDQIEQIRQGLLIYSGLSYNTEFANIDNLDPLSLYLDTEILFSSYGYNGALYQQLFDDFYNCVYEINKQSYKQDPKRNLISLKYFKETKAEVDMFFNAAKAISEGSKELSSPTEAMRTILNKASGHTFRVQEEKTMFYDFLKDKNILVFKEQYEKIPEQGNDESENSSSDQIIENELGIYGGNDLYDKYNYCLDLLRNIYCLRGKGTTSFFHSAKHLLITDNRCTLSMAYDESKSHQNKVWLALDIYTVTSRFWLLLNKGIGKGEWPKSLEVLSLAKNSLSTQLAEAITLQYKNVYNEYKSGKIDYDSATKKIASLRNELKSPDQLNQEDDIDSSLRIIDNNEVERVAADMVIDRKKKEEQIKKLNEQIKEKEENSKRIDERLEKLYNKLLDDENEKRKSKYDNELCNYNDEKTKWCTSKFRKRVCISISLALAVIISLVISVLCAIYTSKFYSGFIPTPTLVIILLILDKVESKIRPYINQSWVKKGFCDLYKLLNGNKDDILEEIEDSYDVARPEFVPATIDEIYEQIDESGNNNFNVDRK